MPYPNGCPYPIAFALSTALRLVPTFAGAGATIIQAQVSRGLDLESGNIFSRMVSLFPKLSSLHLRYPPHQSSGDGLRIQRIQPESKRTLYYEPKCKE